MWRQRQPVLLLTNSSRVAMLMVTAVTRHPPLAGNNGVPAYINGEFQGLISGVAPRARLATYKVCWDGPNPDVTTDDGCASADSAAAIDQAVADGVDVINFSIGGSSNSFGSRR